MGINDREDEGKRNKRTRAKEARSRRASAGVTVSWETFDWIVVQEMVKVLVALGGAVRIGATRDGNAWAFGIYVGDDYATEYVRPSEDFERAIAEIVDAWAGDEMAKKWWDNVLTERALDAR